MVHDPEATVDGLKKPKSYRKSVCTKCAFLVGIVSISLLVSCMIMVVRYNSKYFQQIMFDESSILRKLVSDVETLNEKSSPPVEDIIMEPIWIDEYYDSSTVENKIDLEQTQESTEDTTENCPPVRRLLIIDGPYQFDDTPSDWCENMTEEEKKLGWNITTYCTEIATRSPLQVNIYNDNVTIIQLNTQPTSSDENIYRSYGDMHSKRIQIEEYPCVFAKLTCEQLRKRYQPFKVYCQKLEPNRQGIWITDDFGTLDAVSMKGDGFETTPENAEQRFLVPDGIDNETDNYDLL
ncbi:uncharacterized protein LOC129744932 [Uranotaenia lowii]|uniref:uncharacterized protein LOC129744932 n=1 Tax=Uranotaenia lowii TaxID=190385 RepID=UPI002478D6E7|nr:uncharacterized protein LOC129744932 [Uranotaenia lowii]